MSVVIFRNLNLVAETGLRKKRKTYISERFKMKHALGFQKKEGSLWAEVVGEISHLKCFSKHSFQWLWILWALQASVCREGRMPHLPLTSIWTWTGHISASANKENDLYALSISGIYDLRILLGHYAISIMFKKKKKFSLKSQKISCLVLWKAGLNTKEHSLWSTWDGEFYIP